MASDGSTSAIGSSPLYTSHTGKQTRVSEMARPYLVAALARLQGQAHLMHRLLNGTASPQESSDFQIFQRLYPWCPAPTPGELLLRTDYWIGILENELKLDDEIKWRKAGA
jgi:hypothetical protein